MSVKIKIGKKPHDVKVIIGDKDVTSEAHIKNLKVSEIHAHKYEPVTVTLEVYVDEVEIDDPELEIERVLRLDAEQDLDKHTQRVRKEDA